MNWCFLLRLFFLVFVFSSTIGSLSAALPDKANLDYPCFERYEPDSWLGQTLTGRNKGKPGGIYSHYLVPPMANELGLELLRDNRGVVFCSGTPWGDHLDRAFGKANLKNRHSLWLSSSGLEVYFYDHRSQQLIHVWSKLEDARGFDEVWVDHLNQIAWSDRVYNTIEIESGFLKLDQPVLMSYNEALEYSQEYQTLNLPQNIFQLPRERNAFFSFAWGLSYLAPAMQSSSGEKTETHYWLQRESSDDEMTVRRFNGRNALIVREYNALRMKEPRYFVRYIIQGDNFERMQSEGLISRQRSESEILASPSF